MQLAQSPFLNILSDQKVQDTLKLMGRSPSDRLTPEVARELCQRAGSKAYLSGSIASLGSQYVIGLKAVNCQTGDSITQEQTTANGKEHVLKALDGAATKLREKVGESLGTIQKFATPLEQATTPSLEALQAYSLGRKTLNDNVVSTDAVRLFQRAITLDPNFAMAYASLGASYDNLEETGLAAENMRKAYELRERVSEREKSYIESHYYDQVTGDAEKACQVYELWSQAYPRDDLPPYQLTGWYADLGQHDKALAEARETVRVDPDAGSYARLAAAYSNLNRLEEARASLEEARAKDPDSPQLHGVQYYFDFLQNDAEGMAQQVAWSAGKPGAEDLSLMDQSFTEAYFGHIGKARESLRQAVDSAERSEEKARAAVHKADAAETDAEYGNSERAHQEAAAALALSSTRDVRVRAAAAMARAGDSARAEKMADQLSKEFPQNTIVNRIAVPIIRAAIEINRNNPGKTVEVLQTVSPYELGEADSLYSVYLRGQAYLLLRQGKEAATEFQKILDHRSIVLNYSQGALAHLGLAGAYVMQGDTAKARAAYQDFLTLWKDADPDIPILKQAKAEYAKLDLSSTTLPADRPHR